jgi:transposase
VFLKKLQRQKNGKDHVYWALVESYRTARGPRHRTVAYLGELGKKGQGGWAHLARRLDGKAEAVLQGTLFCVEEESEPVPANVTVNVNGVRVTGVRDFGDVWLGLVLWRTLGLDELFGEILPKGREEIGWEVMAAILTLARFCEPSSELHIEDTWYPRTCLRDLLGVVPEKVYVKRLYRALGVLVPYKESVEKHLKKRLGELFDLDYELLLYDVTSTYFEGQARKNPQARHGYSRDKRPDCKQICIGLVVTTEGFPLGYEVFDGNRNDVTTVEDIVEHMEAKYGRASRIWVLDRGMVNEDNLEFIRERDGYYVVGTPRSWMKRYEQELTGTGWSNVYEDVEVKLCQTPDGQETFVLCRSRDRAEKEKAMHERFSERMEKALEKLGNRLARARKRPNRGQVERQIGRLMARNSRVSGKYQIDVLDDPQRKGHLKLKWTANPTWSDWASLIEGAYLLRTNLNDREPEELWRTYIQLVDAEEAFRTIKSELCLRPIFHQDEDMVQAHVLVSFLSYAMWKTLQKWMMDSGLGRGVRTVLEEFARIKVCQVMLPTNTGREVELTCVSEPDEWQRSLLQRLGIEIPSRLGQPRWRKMAETLSPL